MAALDRDYEEYCREREAQFHRDFDDWRSRRRSSPEPLQTGMSQTGLSSDPSGITQAEIETAPGTANEPDAIADATLGTNNSENPGGQRKAASTRGVATRLALRG
jgi:hypothetical protein